MASIGQKLRDFFSGDFILHGVVLKYWKLIAYLTFLLIAYLYNGFAAQNEVRQIQRLQKEILYTRYQMLDISAEYTQLTRPSNLNKLLKENNSPIHESTIPPTEIK